MNKAKSNFRKCGFCQHHEQQPKCCCKRPLKSTEKIKKNKPKHNPLINESSIRYIDENQLRYQQLNLSNLIAQNSMLKCENSNLKSNLLSLSHCINDERQSFVKQYSSVMTSNTLKTESEQSVMDRLYISNKNLQEAVFQIDNLSKRNKQICDKNSLLSSEVQALALQNQELKQDILTLKKQLKKSQQNQNNTQKNTLRENYKVLRQKYENLKIQNSDLTQEIDKLKLELSRKHSLPSDNLSPEWIASTSNKLTFIEQKIDCAENRLKNQDVQKYQKLQYNPNFSDNKQNQSNSSYFQIVHQMKTQIALAINTIHSKTRKFNSIFDTIGNVENMNVKGLVCTLIQGFVESCLNLNMTVEKQLNRRINVLEKRMQNLLGKLQNFVLQIKNRQLRKRSTSRSQILTKNKSGLSSKFPLNSNKENICILNNLDKSY